MVRGLELLNMINCFAEGSKVLMGDSSFKNIETVQIGEFVLTYNFTKKKFEKNMVLKIDSPFHMKFVKIHFSNGEEVISTKDHPYFVKGKGWCSFDPALTFKNYGLIVGKLETKDICLYYKRGKLMRTKILKIVEFESLTKTYNLSKIANSNNYFVNGILVNNESENK